MELARTRFSSCTHWMVTPQTRPQCRHSETKTESVRLRRTDGGMVSVMDELGNSPRHGMTSFFLLTILSFFLDFVPSPCMQGIVHPSLKWRGGRRAAGRHSPFCFFVCQCSCPEFFVLFVQLNSFCPFRSGPCLAFETPPLGYGSVGQPRKLV